MQPMRHPDFISWLVHKLHAIPWRGLCLPLLCLPLTVFAQNDSLHTDRALGPPEKLLITQPWLASANAAALGLRPLPERGSASLQGYQESGHFRRAQQPDRTQKLIFQSARYQRIKAVSIYGRFQFTQQQDDSIRYADILNPYRGTPYILADSIGGDWKKQFYQLQMKMASGWLAHHKLKIGVGIDYENGTGARQNDPRPLNYANTYSVTPSLLYQLTPQSHLGLNGYYAHFREEVSLSIQTNGNSHKLYKLLGLGYYSPPTSFSTSTTRTYQGNTIGGDLLYTQQHDATTWITEAGMRRYTEDTWDGSSIPRATGLLAETDYTFHTVLQYHRGAMLRQLKLALQGKDYQGTEYSTSYDSDVRKWIITTELPLYSGQAYQGSLSFEWMKQITPYEYQWLLHAEVNGTSLERHYTYPVAHQLIRRITGLLRGGRNWLLHEADLQCLLQVQYSNALQTDLTYTDMTTTTNLIAQEVLYPDQDYMGATTWGASGSVNYIFKQAKDSKNRFFVKADAQFIQRSSAVTVNNGFDGSRTTVMFTVGSLY